MEKAKAQRKLKWPSGKRWRQLLGNSVNTQYEPSQTASRRDFLRGVGGVMAAGVISSTATARTRSNGASDKNKILIAINDRAIGFRQQLGAFAVAAKAGAALEVDLGRLGSKGSMQNRLLDAVGRQLFLDAADKAGVAIGSLAITALLDQSFASHPKADEYVSDLVFIAREMGVGLAILPFGSAADLNDAYTRNLSIQRLRGLAPQMERAGIVLALDAPVDAKLMRSILDEIDSPAIRACVSVDADHNGIAAFKQLGATHVAQIRIHADADGQSAVDALRPVLDSAGWRGWFVVARPAMVAGDVVGNAALAVRHVESVFSHALV